MVKLTLKLNQIKLPNELPDNRQQLIEQFIHYVKLSSSISTSCPGEWVGVENEINANSVVVEVDAELGKNGNFKNSKSLAKVWLK